MIREFCVLFAVLAVNLIVYGAAIMVLIGLLGLFGGAGGRAERFAARVSAPWRIEVRAVWTVAALCFAAAHAYLGQRVRE